MADEDQTTETPAPTTGPPAPSAGPDESTLPWRERSPEGQVKYWQDQAKRHEATVKKVGNVDEVLDRANKYDALLKASQTDQERAVEAARAEERARALSETAPRLLKAEFKALSAGRQVNGSALNVDAILGGLDARRFISDDGEVDTDRVTAFLDGIAPVVKPKAGPTAYGAGSHGGTPGTSVSDGASEYARRHPARK